MSYYDLTENVHESLLFSNYLRWTNGTKLSADLLEHSTSLITGLFGYNDTHYQLVTTDSYKLNIITNTKSALQVYSTTT